MKLHQGPANTRRTRPVAQRIRRPASKRLVLRGFVAVAVVIAGTLHVRADQGTVDLGRPFSNFFDQPSVGAASGATFVWADGTNHRLFEAVNPNFQSSWCNAHAADDTNTLAHQGDNMWAEYDAATGALVGARCSLPMVTLQETIGSETAPGYRSGATVDSTD